MPSIETIMRRAREVELRKFHWHGGRRHPAIELLEVVFTSLLASGAGTVLYPLMGGVLEMALTGGGGSTAAAGAFEPIAAHIIYSSVLGLLLAMVKPIHGGLRGVCIFLWLLAWRHEEMSRAGGLASFGDWSILLVLGLITCMAAGMVGAAMSRSMALASQHRELKALREQERDFL